MGKMPNKFSGVNRFGVLGEGSQSFSKSTKATPEIKQRIKEAKQDEQNRLERRRLREEKKRVVAQEEASWTTVGGQKAKSGDRPPKPSQFVRERLHRIDRSQADPSDVSTIPHTVRTAICMDFASKGNPEDLSWLIHQRGFSLLASGEERASEVSRNFVIAAARTGRLEVLRHLVKREGLPLMAPVQWGPTKGGSLEGQKEKKDEGIVDDRFKLKRRSTAPGGPAAVTVTSDPPRPLPPPPRRTAPITSGDINSNSSALRNSLSSVPSWMRPSGPGSGASSQGTPSTLRRRGTDGGSPSTLASIDEQRETHSPSGVLPSPSNVQGEVETEKAKQDTGDKNSPEKWERGVDRETVKREFPRPSSPPRQLLVLQSTPERERERDANQLTTPLRPRAPPVPFPSRARDGPWTNPRGQSLSSAERGDWRSSSARRSPSREDEAGGAEEEEEPLARRGEMPRLPNLPLGQVAVCVSAYHGHREVVAWCMQRRRVPWHPLMDAFARAAPDGNWFVGPQLKFTSLKSLMPAQKESDKKGGGGAQGDEASPPLGSEPSPSGGLVSPPKDSLASPAWGGGNEMFEEGGVISGGGIDFGLLPPPRADPEGGMTEKEKEKGVPERRGGMQGSEGAWRLEGWGPDHDNETGPSTTVGKGGEQREMQRREEEGGSSSSPSGCRGGGSLAERLDFQERAERLREWVQQGERDRERRTHSHTQGRKESDGGEVSFSIRETRVTSTRQGDGSSSSAVSSDLWVRVAKETGVKREAARGLPRRDFKVVDSVLQSAGRGAKDEDELKAFLQDCDVDLRPRGLTRRARELNGRMRRAVLSGAASGGNRAALVLLSKGLRVSLGEGTEAPASVEGLDGPSVVLQEREWVLIKGLEEGQMRFASDVAEMFGPFDWSDSSRLVRLDAQLRAAGLHMLAEDLRATATRGEPEEPLRSELGGDTPTNAFNSPSSFEHAGVDLFGVLASQECLDEELERKFPDVVDLEDILPDDLVALDYMCTVGTMGTLQEVQALVANLGVDLQDPRLPAVRSGGGSAGQREAEKEWQLVAGVLLGGARNGDCRVFEWVLGEVGVEASGRIVQRLEEMDSRGVLEKVGGMSELTDRWKKFVERV
uniref:Uncharacterized protein n=1 Tax=Chromera velia CCMP2878 TaxID=1169474 RepID=A0A0G4FXE3_9ALVE|eukprot:Cvel_19256.t1-p1 / transcript=Cvel_19256.t1 / gene=Cvel_19256 / organism=Chromera_velia_CCMP2878 / gene_product=hypothetical protein / transcript_product=hypothetical protein / location=Cvel_scaffold1648:13915-19434(+) / protein_length=1109 / sequence_SO=supercontig / SO=protein_coding / is_pseudo=false